jgi:hypothetical protein
MKNRVADQVIPQKHPTTVEFNFDGAGWKPLRFVRWTPRFLVVEYPTSGKPWRIGYPTVRSWITQGVMRLDGFLPAEFKAQKGVEHG